MSTNGGTAVAVALEALGVTRMFVVPSAHNLTILREIHRRGRIAVTGCRHEQGVVHAADGYARTTGGLGVGLVSTGPGTANAMGGLYEAHFASSPLLLITSQIPTPELGRGRGYVHEADRQPDMLRTACSEVETVIDPRDVGDTVIRLGLAATAGRPRPVGVEIPIDVQDAPAPLDEQRLLDLVQPARRPGAPDEAIARAVDVLAAAERPLVWAGGGVLRAGAEKALVEFAHKWGAPVLTSREGRGAIPDDDGHSLAALGAIDPLPAYIAGCDAVLAVGTRFQQYPTASWTLPFPAALVHLDVDPTVIGRAYPAAVPLVADALEGLQALTAALPDPPRARARARARHLETGRRAADRARALVVANAGPDHTLLCETINRRRPRGGTVVRDATVPAYVWGESLLSIWEPRTSIRSTAAGIGPGLPLAIGAALAGNDHVVLLQGDGGLMLSLGELATAVQTGARVVICLFNDSGYQMLRNIEGTVGDGGLHDVDLAAPDFAALARTFGANSHLVAGPAEFDTAFAEALTYDGPTLIEITMSALAPLTFPLVAEVTR